MKSNPHADTDELPRALPVPESPLSVSSQVRVEFAALSNRGKVRAANEDHFLVARAARRFDVLASNLPTGEVTESSEEAAYGMIVADGMGGEEGGEVASRVAISTMVELVLEQPDWILRYDDATMAEAIQRARQRFRKVNIEIGRLSQQDPGLARMGTTMTMACSLGTDLFVAHVGDSRAYHWRGGHLTQLTRDHTLAQRLQDLGEMTSEQAGFHRLRHVLTNALGQQDPNLAVDVQRLRLADGDRLLLCSDGLTELVEDAEIAAVLASDGSADEDCRALVELALARGGTDNVTVIVARYRIPDSVP